MFRIGNNGVITMHRGDDISFPLFLNKGTEYAPIRYEFNVGDGCEVYFYIMLPHTTFDNALVKKTFTTETGENINENKDMIISLDSSDTMNLYQREYFYEVRVKVFLNGKYEYNTVIGRTPILIVES